jgi:hypothetical protein
MSWCNSQVMESAVSNSAMKGKKQCCWGNCNVQTLQDFTWTYDVTIMWWLGAQKNHTSSFCTSQDIVDLSTAWWHQKDQNMPPERMTWLVEWCLVLRLKSTVMQFHYSAAMWLPTIQWKYFTEFFFFSHNTATLSLESLSYAPLFVYIFLIVSLTW